MRNQEIFEMSFIIYFNFFKVVKPQHKYLRILFYDFNTVIELFQYGNALSSSFIICKNNF